MKKYFILLVFILSGCEAPTVVVKRPEPVPPPVVSSPPVEVPVPPVVVTPPVTPKPRMEVMGYYAGWTEKKFPVTSVNMKVLTQVHNFSALPNIDGTLDTTHHSLSPKMLATAKAAGLKVLLTVGSANTATGFRGATNTMDKFVANIVALAQPYDGVDIDWEQLEDQDSVKYTALITALRAAIPNKILAVAISDRQAKIIAPLAGKIDQVNLMTYNCAGPWSGWVTYHNSAVFSYGPKFIRSVDSMVNVYLAAGIPASKIGIGVAFFGKVWTNVSKPFDSWTAATLPVQTDIDYNDVVKNYLSKGATPIWDDKAQAVYLSDPIAKRFISYDNEQSIASKLAYVKAKGLRGVIIWELSAAPALMSAFPVK